MPPPSIARGEIHRGGAVGVNLYIEKARIDALFDGQKELGDRQIILDWKCGELKGGEKMEWVAAS